ncbi:hypothetical protein [Candidatus Formimonas warabiya]|uniref:Alkaline phosphatase family protein n=1 Tax=Formimonas warabiya TaxID=1761012 RepID=A0A3G1KQ17_FORW1|nr:hypothetical protein [Candidatus Formimonas warabiya]ATW24527.1 hypothetical protein DCMF_06800 [Candidatus Formimonas warabiya]
MRKILFLLLILLVTLPQESAWAQPAKKAVLVLVDYVTLQELKEAPMPTLHRMIREGGLSLINTNTAGSRVRENSCVTIGAGRVALGSSKAGLAFGAWENYQDEAAGEIYRRRTGQVPDPDSMVNLDIAEILRSNEEKSNTGYPGLLGERLHRAGLKTAVIGTADSGERYDRHGAAIAMDRSGRVDFAYTGEQLLRADGENLLLLSANYDQMGVALEDALKKADFIVVETGDTTRLVQQKDLALDRVFLESKQQTLGEIDRFLAGLIPTVEKYQTLVMVAAPTPSREAIEERNLVTPLIYWKKDGEAGFLTSGTTRREGIVANTDIAPTVLDFFGLPVPEDMSGRPVRVVPAQNTLASLLTLNDQLAFVNKARSPLVKGYVLGQIIVVLVTVLSLFYPGKISRYMQPVLLALASIPLIFLILGAFPGPSLSRYIFTGLVFTVAVTALCLSTVLYHDLAPFLTVSLLTAGTLLVDLGLGAPLMQKSVLGYDPMGGARYYGIGNEYMGVWIGAAIMATASLLQITRHQKIFLWAATGVFFLIIFMMASPRIGSEAGGSLAAVVGFGYTIYSMLPVKISRKQLALAAAGMLIFLVSFALWDAHQAVGVQSHFGRTINLVRTNGMSEAYNIIVRKVALNLKLIRWTIWSQVFLVTLLATALLFYRPVGLMKKVSEKYPFLTKGFWGVVIGSLLALILNDSGIVAAATMSIFAAAPLIFVLIKEQGTRTP